MYSYLSRILFLCGVLSFASQTVSHAALSLHSEEPKEASIYFSGDWGQSPGYLTRAELAAIEGYTTIRTEVFPGAAEADLGVLPLKSLIDVLGIGETCDGFVLECTDAWESFVTLEYIEANDPVMLLYYNGKSPEESEWPMFGGDIEALAPYYVFVVGDMSGYEDAPKYGMISATQMNGIHATNTAKRYAPFYNAPMDKLSPMAQAGRDLFLQRCNVCHQGPGNVGGNVSQRPLIVLQGHATYNADYLAKMVVNPKQFYPNTIMPNHEDFDAEKLSKITAYLKETSVLMK
ncbi:c-type cytochrome [Coraliomargarita sp. SDUM461004]|uniref:C-type cytochrome n=1 Tax=Thalassobacterium sedimentorum TaxID=3041258 RepID=A0ABU1AHZ0_9BACT|nr:c-type cytochrome [Coraliomargarita sp. SDUM461004]MDQ8194398.1 c-type cytochrome [Coraliomargarita sp. SDUM461004]